MTSPKPTGMYNAPTSGLSGPVSYMGHNRVQDYSKLQGVFSPTDLTNQIRRDYHARYITVENSSRRPVGVAITTYSDGPPPPIQFTLAGGEVKHLAINSIGGPDQYVWVFDHKTKKLGGEQVILDRGTNSFVIRDGLNKFWIQRFYRAVYNA